MSDDKKFATSKTPDAAPEIVTRSSSASPPQPKVLSGEPADVDPHLLPKASADWAGTYRLTGGTVRIGDQFYGVGSLLQLGADDGKNFSGAGVAERVED